MVVTKSGYKMMVNDCLTQDMEWSSKSDVNAYHAVYSRQTCSLTSVDDEMFAAFKEMTGRFWAWFAQKWQEIDIFEINEGKINLFDVLDDKLQFDDTKKLKYFETLVEEKAGRKTSFLGRGFTTMIKQGEVYSMDESTQVDEFGRIKEHESRPRNISKPSPAS